MEEFIVTIWLVGRSWRGDHRLLGILGELVACRKLHLLYPSLKRPSAHPNHDVVVDSVDDGDDDS